MTRTKTSIIIDTDPGVDDILALLLALASPEVEISVIVVSYGNTDLDSACLNVLKTYEAVEKQLAAFPDHEYRFPGFFQSIKTILAKGQDKALDGETKEATYFHGRDGLSDITNKHPDLGPSDFAAGHPRIEVAEQSALEVSLSVLGDKPEQSVTYVVLGPMTNLAALVRADRALVASKVARLVVMGGALDVPGNTTPVAEFNFYADPYAVKELLCPVDEEPPLPLDRYLILPLDITVAHELPYPVYQKRVDNTFRGTAQPSVPEGKSPVAHFTSSFLERTRDIMNGFGKDVMELHDIAAVWCAICNPPSPSGTLAAGWEAERRIFDIERTGELTRGMLVVDRREETTSYAVGANRQEVQAQLDEKAVPVPARVEVVTVDQTVGVGTSKPPGVPVVTRTPGPDVLLELLLNRVWNA